MYITVGTYPAIKIAGEITSIDEDIESFTYKDTLEFSQSLINEKQHERLLKEKNLDFSFSFARGCACISKIKSTMADKIYRAGRVSCASSQPNIFFLGSPALIGANPSRQRL